MAHPKDCCCGKCKKAADMEDGGKYAKRREARYKNARKAARGSKR
jgi:hypothetical protein